MTVDRRVSSIESSFKMEGMPFDAECRQRVRNVLVKKVSAADAIIELNKIQSIQKQVEGSKYDYFYDDEQDAKYCYPGTNVLKNKSI